jgi:hypothetical protein
MRLGPLGYHDTCVLILAPPAGLGAGAPARFYNYISDVCI